MPVWGRPAILLAAWGAGGDSNVEARFDATDFLQNGLVQLLFGNRPVATTGGARRDLKVFIVQAEGHCPQDNIEALRQNVVVGAEFGDVLPGQGEAGAVDFGIVFQREEKPFELGGGLLRFGELIKIKTQFGGLAGWRAVHDAEGVFDELVVEPEERPFDLLPGETDGLVDVLAEHDSDFQVALPDLLEKDSYQVLLLGQIGGRDFGPLHLAEQVEAGLLGVQPCGDAVVLGGSDHYPAVKVGVVSAGDVGFVTEDEIFFFGHRGSDIASKGAAQQGGGEVIERGELVGEPGFRLCDRGQWLVRCLLATPLGEKERCGGDDEGGIGIQRVVGAAPGGGIGAAILIMRW